MEERKNQLYDKILTWIGEHFNNDEKLSAALRGNLGMSKQMPHDHSIDSLDAVLSL